MANQKKIIIFHVFPDDKFFDGTAKFFDNLANVENRYVFLSKEKNYQFKLIKKTDRIKIVNSIISFVRELRRRDINIVLFHTMIGKSYILTRFIRQNVKVIWWSWGYDIYMGRYHTKPLINIPLYKPLTLDIKNKNEIDKTTIYEKIKGKVIEWIREGAIKRVDYFMPVIPIDYKLMKEQCSFFNAQLFPKGINQYDYSFKYKDKIGNLLVGNSLTYTNNHLDIFEKLYEINIYDGMKIVVPVSYGCDYCGVENLISLTHFPEDRVIWLKEYLSRDRYFAIFDNISHAIFGMMRQQGMGNILYCLRTGVKVYVYKDSVIARQLKEYGYIFFTIEDDLDALSLSSCLSKEEARHNFNIYMMRYDNSRLEDVCKRLNDIINT